MNRNVLVLVSALLLAPSVVASPPGTDDKGFDLSVTTKPWKGDLDGMLKRGTIRALVPYSQTYYYVVKGTPRGIAYESLKAFETFVNKKHPPKRKGLGVRVVFLPVPRDELLTRLEQGLGDVAVAGLAVTPERRQRVDFSEPTAGGINEIAVTGPESPALSTLDDLSGRDIFVRKSSPYWEHVQQLNERFRKEAKKAVILRAAPEDLEDEDILEMVDAGLIPATVMDNFVPKLWAHIYTRARPHADVVVHADDEFAWGLRKGTPQLKEIVNEFVRTHGKGTAFGNTLLQRYMESDRMIRNATSVAERDKFDRTIEFFRKYGEKYDIDYLLMVSQGYQESGLDQNVRSKVGAIGVMQLMPATGRQMQVGDVQLVAAEKIGMETATYVSNIYKYYVAYKLLLDLQEERKKEMEALEKAKPEGRI